MPRTLDDGVPVTASRKKSGYPLVPLLVLSGVGILAATSLAVLGVVMLGKSGQTRTEPTTKIEPFRPSPMPIRPNPDKGVSRDGGSGILGVPSVPVPNVPLPKVPVPPVLSANPRADVEGLEWSLADLGNWLKSNGVIQAWEKSGRDSIIVKVKENQTTYITKHSGPIVAESATKPGPISTDYETPSVTRDCWGVFVCSMHHLFKKLPGARYGDYKDDSPVTTPY